MTDILKYFPELSPDQSEKLLRLEKIYARWNSMINVISRKDMDNFMVHHVLHSLSVAKVFDFPEGTTILDVGTGGGFPGIPLAVVFPGTRFTLLDSITKKIKVVSAVAEELGLENVNPANKRVEDEKGVYDFVIARAVTEFGSFVKMTKKNVRNAPDSKAGIISLKGGDLEAELGRYRQSVHCWDIRTIFDEPFFETKKIVYLPVGFF